MALDGSSDIMNVARLGLIVTPTYLTVLATLMGGLSTFRWREVLVSREQFFLAEWIKPWSIKKELTIIV